MPFVEIKLWKGRSESQKKEMIRRVTDAIEESISCPRNKIIVTITEIEPKDWSEGGKTGDEK